MHTDQMYIAGRSGLSKETEQVRRDEFAVSYDECGIAELVVENRVVELQRQVAVPVRGVQRHDAVKVGAGTRLNLHLVQYPAWRSGRRPRRP